MTRVNDIAGQRFARLTVVERAENSFGGRARWRCVCDCGGETITLGHKLTSGHTKSCGCLQREKAVKNGEARAGHVSPRRLDLTGQRFGRLVALKLSDSRGPSNQIKWDCACDCGETIAVMANSLRNGTTQSCGCLQREKARENRVVDLNGKRFGNLVAISSPETGLWECVCDCGTITTVGTGSLNSGNTQSCGCVASFVEKDLLSFVRTLDPDAVGNTKIDGIDDYRFDVFSAKHRIVVEFNGLYWHSTARKSNRRYHIEKRLAAEAAGLRMITIWEDEWSINRKRFEHLLRRAFGHQQRSIGARKLTVMPVGKAIATDHHNRYHTQGHRGGDHFGLFNKDDLIAVATFRKIRDELHVIRYTVKHGYSVPGGLRRLIAATEWNGIVVSYVDRDHFDGTSYLASGFTRTRTTIGYTYMLRRMIGGKSRDVRHAREIFQKHKLPKLGVEVRPDDTEFTAMERAGGHQCWNSGVDRMELHITAPS